MSNDAGGGAPKKLTTQDILAQARARAAAKSGGPAPEETAPAQPTQSVQPAAAAEAPAAQPAAKPKSTADILAAARAAAAAKAASGESAAAEPAKPAAPKAAGDKPKSTADILAAARAAKAGGATAPAGDKPKSTADILAAARAGTAGAGAAVPAKDKPAAKAPAKGAVAADGGKKPSVQEMLAAVRGQGAAAAAPEAAPAKKPVAAPPMPVKPMPPKAAKEADVDRRSFLLATVLSPFAMAWTMFAGATLAATLGAVRFMLPNVLTEPPSKFKVGPPADYDLGTVSEKFKASNGIWIVHTDKYHGKNLIYALSSVCTHLGCTPSWLEGEQKFKCPCHGSGFYINGINFEGPAPRPLERVGVRLAEDGMLEVDKSLKFQEEMGQWADPASFVEVG
jgi:cytochrome b6-f complex iron-sulfur subunit